MFSQFLIAVFLSLFVVASPLVVRDGPISIPLARRFNVTGAKNVLTADQARAEFLKGGNRQSILNAGPAFRSVPVANSGFVYTAAIDVSSPPTTFNLIVDTGSSNTWVGAGTPYQSTKISQDTGDGVLVEYGSSIFFGEEFLDTVALSNHLTINRQSIGVAQLAVGFGGFDGILGVGPTVLTNGTTLVDGMPGGLIPTVTDNLFAQKRVLSKQVGVFFEPKTSSSIARGGLTFGGADTSKFGGPLHLFPVTSTSPASKYVGVDQSITYGSSKGTTILAETAGIADTGTTLILIASDAFATYQRITGAVADDKTGSLKLTNAQFARLRSLFFNIHGRSFEITPNAQIWPRALNNAIGGDANGIYLIIGDVGSPLGEGLDFINGFAFLERYHLLFDTGASQVGFAETPFTFAATN